MAVTVITDSKDVSLNAVSSRWRGAFIRTVTCRVCTSLKHQREHFVSRRLFLTPSFIFALILITLSFTQVWFFLFLALNDVTGGRPHTVQEQPISRKLAYREAYFRSDT